jgi:hypothetical protein
MFNPVKRMIGNQLADDLLVRRVVYVS